MRDDIIFTTLCICGPDLDELRTQFKGELHYFKVCNILIHSILKNTCNSIVVITDSPQLFIQHERVILKNIYDLTNEPLLKAGYMNFHLKRIAMNEGFLMDKKYTIYVDCDVFVEHFDYGLFDILDNIECDIIGRLGVSPLSSYLGEYWLEEKIQQAGDHWTESLLEATLPHETILVFKSNRIKQSRFIEFWNKLSDEVRLLDVTTHRDSFYIGTSSKVADMKEFNLSIYGNSDVFWDGLRIIHADYVNTIYVSPLELFEYERLLSRMK